MINKGEERKRKEGNPEVVNKSLKNFTQVNFSKIMSKYFMYFTYLFVIKNWKMTFTFYQACRGKRMMFKDHINLTLS